MNCNKRSWLKMLAAYGLSHVASYHAWAEKLGTPQSKPLQIIVPSQFGDQIILRVVESIAKNWPGGYYLTFKPGANGVIAYSYLLSQQKSQPTIMINTTGISSLNIATKDDFLEKYLSNTQFIGSLYEEPVALICKKNAPSDFRKFLEYLKTNSRNYSSNNVNGFIHLTTAYFLSRFGVVANHIPYQSNYILSVLQNDVDFAFVAIGRAIEYADQVNVLAVTSLKRLSLMPHIPALNEFLPGFSSIARFGLVTNLHMSKEEVMFLNGLLKQLRFNKHLLESLKNNGSILNSSMTPASYENVTMSDAIHWKKILTSTQLSD